MTPITKNVVLGFYDDIGTPVIYAKLNDTERKVTFELVDSLASYVIEDTTHIFLKETFSNGYVLSPQSLKETAEFSEDYTEMTIKLTQHMLGIQGVAHCEIVFCKCDTEPTITEDGHIDDSGVEYLSTQNFNIFIDSGAYIDGCSMTSADQLAVSELVPLLIKVESVLDHDEEYQHNEEQRMANEIARQSNEGYRQEAENERDRLNNKYSVLFNGGTYIDDDGQEIDIVNSYTKKDGTVVYPDDSTYHTSFRALAAYMDYIADYDYYTKLSKSYAIGGSGLPDRPNEDTDNAKYYCNRSAEIKTDTETIKEETQNIRNSIDEALEENVPNVWLDLETGQLMYTGGRFSFEVNNDDGCLYWSLN